MLVFFVVWLALIVYTYLDARRRIADPFLIACATIASFFPYVGTAVYAIVRPPEFLEDAHERELEIRAAELRVRQLTEVSCPNCQHPIEKDFLRCPSCQHRLKVPCPSCARPVAPDWRLCPYCETVLQSAERRAPSLRGAGPRRASRGAGRASPWARGAPRREAAAGCSKKTPRSIWQGCGDARGPERGAEPETTTKEPQP